MGKYNGPKCRLCRSEGEKLFLKGEKCSQPNCPFSKRKGRKPGPHWQLRRKQSEYGIQIREKQKTKRIYGMLEGQFRLFFERAEKMDGIVGENFLSLLERRLDNVIYRLGFARSRSEARQLLLHDFISVNGKKVDIASFIVNEGDEIAIRNRDKAKNRFKDILDVTEARQVPAWLQSDTENLKGSVLSLPTRDEIDTQVNETHIVELYAR